MKNAPITHTASGALARIDSIDAQFALFDRFHLARTMVETHRFVATDDDKHPYKLIKRENPVRIYDNGNNIAVVSQLCKTYSERVGISRSSGKYNDEGRLLTSEALSIGVGDVEAWATI